MRTTVACFASVLLLATSCKDKPTPASSPPENASASVPASATPSASPSATPSTRRSVGHWSFDEITPGALPPGFTLAAGRWEVTADKVIRQLAENPTRVFNLILADKQSRDPIVHVRMRAISGKIDQGGGVVWRVLDARNYYVARYNPLEKNVRAYTVEAGKRTQLASADCSLAADAWHTLEVRMRGARIEVGIDGKRYLELTDETFDAAGAIGLWTKADAVTEFDDLDLAHH